jgi:hypothetical protein
MGGNNPKELLMFQKLLTTLREPLIFFEGVREEGWREPL